MLAKNRQKCQIRWYNKTTMELFSLHGFISVKPRLYSETCGYVHGDYIKTQLTSAVVWPIELLSQVNKQQPSNN